MTFLHSKPKLEFVFKMKSAEAKVDGKALEVYYTLTLASKRLINVKMSQRGDREKIYESLQILIEALTTLGSIVLDAYASTCWYFSCSKGVSSYMNFIVGFVHGLCKFMDLSTFNFQVPPFMLVDIVATMQLHTRKTLHYSMSSYYHCVIQYQLLILMLIWLRQTLSIPMKTMSRRW